MSIFIVTAYHLGWTNGPRYLVYVGEDREKALDLAEREMVGRGGKYGLEVARVSNDPSVRNIDTYFPSQFGELKPHENWRLTWFEYVGLKVCVEWERAKTEETWLRAVMFPRWLRDIIVKQRDLARALAGEKEE